MAEEPKKEESIVQKENSVKIFLIVGLVLTLVAAISGWFLGAWVSREMVPISNSSKEPPVVKTPEYLVAADSHVVILPPILTNIAMPENAWIRMEVSLIIKPNENIEATLTADISNDFLTFLRQVTIDQVKGPSGLMNLRADLLDRARIRSGNKVSNILISSLVVEQ
ncbi:Flagellar basal body-associated protein FliL [Bartonella clarridgeiae 73]|uniref:Flagellar protein FliL n=1 Tax=Bartonella clarridgeiae (strain CCUG 45776 / CIP 104772 / 73) TaxID=696125 RepID=E6YH13_BARC7|nr:flagellar basal body-associated FliL family protein [Bartonella clarridgeiae]CBI76151.1 Flagellar basal body-associated protein FliL [Bartonella clarridgeiae 73]